MKIALLHKKTIVWWCLCCKKREKKKQERQVQFIKVLGLYVTEHKSIAAVVVALPSTLEK